ncbi:aldo-keto reductase, putative [Talaromyces stipitatus ATCC 10500]|uniref:D-xylose reductase [NAD(P)H] n=1 Tax=Talaromyces stipitatus (strain ATCC 10500 / CBS 375.48 / QM 6759 / NRRL 1006) TaxID=441959 RepID=B8MNN0_TALSN|nr:aldo-keto reductase, putative [Talaromyces stipitatus ATCC 10500]EED14119.1 aldo-keto reductase, putative [Talaromyces stipitatus ATCC 10500]
MSALPWSLGLTRSRNNTYYREILFSTKTFTLNTGAAIPTIGLGTWQSKENATRDAVKHALQHGYRHIDTALNYGNEREVGDGIRAPGVPREETWVTTKLDNHWHHRVKQGFRTSLDNLGLDYIYLYLIHFPCSTDPEDRSKHLSDWDFVKTLQEMQRLLETGKVKNIGVSNFQISHLRMLLNHPSCKDVPAVNQIEYKVLHNLIHNKRYAPEIKQCRNLQKLWIHKLLSTCTWHTSKWEVDPLTSVEGLLSPARKNLDDLGNGDPWKNFAQILRRRYPKVQKDKEFFANDNVIILDEAQGSYEDDELWNQIIKDIRGKIRHEIKLCLFASYGSPSTGLPYNMRNYIRPVDFAPEQCISLTPSVEQGSPPIVRDEFEIVVTKLCSYDSVEKYTIDGDARDYIYNFTNGHPGAVGSIVYYLSSATNLNFQVYRSQVKHGVFAIITEDSVI